MMKTALILACITALCAASTTGPTVTISTTPHAGTTAREWWGSDQFWTESNGFTRFPRGGDVVEISESMLYKSEDRPVSGPLYYYDGATEGTDIIIDEWKGLTLDNGDLVIGGQDEAPENCISSSDDWSNYEYGGVDGACSSPCGGGTQTRSRTVTLPRFGGDSCPQSIEVQTCNEQACGCTNDSGFHASGSSYSGFGKNHCNECKCLHGTETCTERVCHDNKDTSLCNHTTCIYGALFDNGDDHIYNSTELETIYPDGNVPTHELTTLVKHSQLDTGAFHCGHDGTACKCFCSDTGTHTIWHRAQRSDRHIDLGLTMAGCKCDDNGCDQVSNMCTFVPGSCTIASAVTANATHDTCEVDEMKVHHKILITTTTAP